MKPSNKKIEDYLKAPYKRVLIPDEESGTYTAEIAEFPGCVSQGQTPQEALENLETAVRGWIEAVLDLGQEVPPPSITEDYSGKLALRLPRSLHRRAAQMAQRDGVSLNLLIATAIAEKVGAGRAYSQMKRQPAPIVHHVIWKQIIATKPEPSVELRALDFSLEKAKKATTAGGDGMPDLLPNAFGNVC
jgi:antitoxin HicB